MNEDKTESVFETSGEVIATDIPELQVRVAKALSSADRDLLLDGRRRYVYSAMTL